MLFIFHYWFFIQISDKIHLNSFYNIEWYWFWPISYIYNRFIGLQNHFYLTCFKKNKNETFQMNFVWIATFFYTDPAIIYLWVIIEVITSCLKFYIFEFILPMELKKLTDLLMFPEKLVSFNLIVSVAQLSVIDLLFSSNLIDNLFIFQSFFFRLTFDFSPYLFILSRVK